MKARRAFIVLLTAGVVGTAAWLVFLSPVLGVRSVHIVGNITIPSEEIKKRAGVAELEPLATVDLAAVESRLLEIRKIATARVGRSWPGTLTIEVVEREPVAVVPVNGKAALIDKDGVVTEIKDVAPPSLPVLRLDRPGPGDPATKAALQVAGSLPAGLSRRVEQIRATSADGVSLTLTDGRVVVWGAADRAEQKSRVLEELLTREGSVYDVSSPDVVTVK
ncbi:cell division protein FtsQ/DivIB [Thermoactinospora rubra]|uniref:cell division protein FtsQ/DivIB n=1 Tax=Thermoactinospora rubra TaxID=1088767 RepID=UPI000A10DBB4|nr:FtsQ-type POTRA domain-containing protein [Thermoactinospora rubra]